jgi:hypothetical protein
MKSLVPFTLLLTLALSSCSELPVRSRMPAEVEGGACTDIAKNIFMSQNYEKDLNQALVDRKLITLKEKLIQLNYPKLEWINRVKKSLNQSIRNWNNNRYPAFYIFSNEDVVPTAKRYAENLEMILANKVPVDDEETTKAFVQIGDWVKAFTNYKTELDQLIEERISLQYNLSLLNKLKLGSDESRDILLTVKRDGVLKNEIVTLRKEDKNLKFTINRFQNEIAKLDGSLLHNGRIKDRLMRQAMLQDILQIVQRETEFVVKNTPQPSDEIVAELEKLSSLIKNSDFAPSTYGIYKVQNKIFIREAIATSKLDFLYYKLKDQFTGVKDIASEFFKNRSAGTETEKIGLFQRIYTNITSITPKQAAIGGTVVATIGLGYERYFWIQKPTLTESSDKPQLQKLDSRAAEQMSPEDKGHQQQVENTKKEEKDKSSGHNQVVEIQIEELTH